MTVTALDTSVAIPLLVQPHGSHRAVSAWARGRPITLAGHAFAETYSVLTRLPGDLRLDPQDAARLIEARFEVPLLMGVETQRSLPVTLATAGIAGGAVYDAMVALAAIEHDALLVTRDARARDTYERVGARVAVL